MTEMPTELVKVERVVFKPVLTAEVHLASILLLQERSGVGQLPRALLKQTKLFVKLKCPFNRQSTMNVRFLH